MSDGKLRKFIETEQKNCARSRIHPDTRSREKASGAAPTHRNMQAIRVPRSHDKDPEEKCRTETTGQGATSVPRSHDKDPEEKCRTENTGQGAREDVAPSQWGKTNQKKMRLEEKKREKYAARLKLYGDLTSAA
jgi:hypothetical protein